MGFNVWIKRLFPRVSFETYTDKLAPSGRAVVREAYEDAKRLGHKELNAVHVFTAITQSDSALFDQLLKRLRLEREVILLRLSSHQTPMVERGGGIKISEELRRVLHHALARAHEQARGKIESADILIGMFRDEGSLPVKLFEEAGACRDEVISAIHQLWS